MTTRTPLIAGNWKMNTTVEEAVNLIKTMQSGLHKIQGVEKVVCPPFVSLVAARAVLKGAASNWAPRTFFMRKKGLIPGRFRR